MAVDISIIVPCRGRATLLQECMASLLSQKTQFLYEVIFVYCQKDFEVDAIVIENKILRVVKSENYLSAGAARGLGAAHAKADILGFIDSDCVVDENWVSTAVETIKNGAVLCSGAIKDALPNHFISCTDNRLQYVDFVVGRPYGIASYFPGAHLAIQRSVFQQTAGFPLYGLGQDVILTMQVAGLYRERVIFNPKLVIKHYGRTQWKEFLNHQKEFGISRATENILINDSMRWLANHPYFGWVIFLRRFVYISLRVVQWNFFDIPRYILQAPILFSGLLYWVIGFYLGFRR